MKKDIFGFGVCWRGHLGLASAFFTLFWCLWCFMALRSGIQTVSVRYYWCFGEKGDRGQKIAFIFWG